MGLICFVVGLILLIVFGVRNRGNKPGFVITTRELPVRRMTATGEIVVEQPESAQASSVSDGDASEALGKDGRTDSANRPADRPAEGGEGDRFAADCEPDSDETPTAEPDRDDVSGSSASATPISPEKEIPSNGNKN